MNLYSSIKYFHGGICLWINTDVEYVDMCTILKRVNQEITQLRELILKIYLKIGSVHRVVLLKDVLELLKDHNITYFLINFFLFKKK